MQAQPSNGLASIADIIDRDAQVGDDPGILQEVQRMRSVDSSKGNVVAEGVHVISRSWDISLSRMECNLPTIHACDKTQ